MKLYTHLNFGGNCEAAFRFYAQQLGGKITMMMKHGELPAGVPKLPGMDEKILHARMSVAGVELIGNDVPPDRFEPVRSSYLYLAVDSVADAERIYGVLSKDGKVAMPMEPTFFASRFAMLRDRFGVLWTILHEQPQGK